MTTLNPAGPWKAMTALRLFTATALLLCTAPAPAAPPGSPWGANYFPDISLVNQDGKTLRFYDEMIKDRVVMINFMYSTCHDACPLETAKLRQVQEALGDRVGKEIFMYSITINPAHDTPAVLKEYAQKFQVGPGWQFLTGKESDINLLRKKLGLYEEGEARTDHTMNLIVGNEATGQWKQRSTFDNPKILARVVGDELFNFSRPRNNETSYAQAPLTLKIDPGEDLFRRRCQVCHTVGGGDALGPDLAGVADIRDRTWLARWLQEPDKMLAEKDPVAATLYAKYKEVPMPNLRLSDRDTELLIAYLESESRRIANTRPQFEHEGHGRLQAASSSGAGVAHLGQAAGEAPHTPFQSP
jgi:protein SCO1/2